MKITISYIPGEAGKASAALDQLRQLLPEAKVRSSASHPPRKTVYLTTRNPGTPCGSKEST